MNNPIKIGLVGLGRAGWGMHLEEIKNKTDKFQVVAVCDILPERNDKAVERLGCKAYSSIEELIADEEVEIVDIATRTVDHYNHAKMALKAGKSVLLEKPVCMSYSQAKELYSLANKPGLPFLFARQNRRFEAVFNIVWDTMKTGVLGDVYEVTISQLGYQRRDDWQTLSEFGGGQLLNWGPHIIDQSLMLLGAPVKKQFGDMKQVAAGGDCEDHFSIHFIGENNRKVNMCISGATALNEGRNYVAYGTRGAIECIQNHIHLKYINPEQKLPPVVSSPDTPGAAFGASGTYESAFTPEWIEEEYDIKYEDLTVIWDHIYNSFRNGAEYPIKDEEVLNLMSVVSRMREDCELADFTAED
ncbi:MAG: Gfo/Idh/MocA family oxidoreductase [Clostridia bacterium]|nr:Gfo/Idh/MocA family oxidoreductase [Clostridia bacterium]